MELALQEAKNTVGKGLKKKKELVCALQKTKEDLDRQRERVAQLMEKLRVLEEPTQSSDKGVQADFKPGGSKARGLEGREEYPGKRDGRQGGHAAGGRAGWRSSSRGWRTCRGRAKRRSSG